MNQLRKMYSKSLEKPNRTNIRENMNLQNEFRLQDQRISSINLQNQQEQKKKIYHEEQLNNSTFLNLPNLRNQMKNDVMFKQVLDKLQKKNQDQQKRLQNTFKQLKDMEYINNKDFEDIDLSFQQQKFSKIDTMNLLNQTGDNSQYKDMMGQAAETWKSNNDQVDYSKAFLFTQNINSNQGLFQSDKIYNKESLKSRVQELKNDIESIQIQIQNQSSIHSSNTQLHNDIKGDIKMRNKKINELQIQNKRFQVFNQKTYEMNQKAKKEYRYANMNKQTAQEKINEISKYETQTIKKIKIHYLNQQKEINQEQQIVDRIQINISNKQKVIQEQKESIKSMDNQIQMKIQKLGDFTQLSSFIQTTDQIYRQFVINDYDQKSVDSILKQLSSEFNSEHKNNRDNLSYDFGDGRQLKASQSQNVSKTVLNPQSDYKVFFQKVNIIKQFYIDHENIELVMDKIISLHQNLTSSKQSYQNLNQEISTKIMELQKNKQEKEKELRIIFEQNEWNQELQKYKEFSRMSVGQINENIEQMIVYSMKMNENYYQKYAYLQSMMMFMFEKIITILDILKKNNHLCGHVNQDGKLSELNEQIVSHFQSNDIFKYQLSYLQKQQKNVKMNALKVMVKGTNMMKNLMKRRVVMQGDSEYYENVRTSECLSPLPKRGVIKQLLEQNDDNQLNQQIIKAMDNNKLFKQYCDNNQVSEYLNKVENKKDVLENIEEHIYKMVGQKVQSMMDLIKEQFIFYEQLLLLVIQYKGKVVIDETQKNKNQMPKLA